MLIKTVPDVLHNRGVGHPEALSERWNSSQDESMQLLAAGGHEIRESTFLERIRSCQVDVEKVLRSTRLSPGFKDLLEP